MKKIIINSVMFLFVLVVFNVTVWAQHGYRVEKRIDFGGKTKVTRKGSIPNPQEGHDYIFSARKGQNLTAVIFSTREDISFFILGPDGEILFNEVELRAWDVELPEDGEYHLIINTLKKGTARYALELTVE